MDIEPFSVTLDPPLATAHGTIDTREGFLVTVEFEGERATGEASPLQGWTESFEACREALGRTATERTASDAGWETHLAQLDASAARHGLSLAIESARASGREQPLYRSLQAAVSGDADGPNWTEPVEQVPVNATLGALGTPAETAAKARSVVGAGFDCVKCKAGTRSVEDDVDRIRAVRSTVGDDIDIRVDANGAWSREAARRAIDELGPLDVEYLEQPLSPDSLDATATLRGNGVDIALDDSLVTHDVETIIDSEAADTLVLKPMVLGGPDRTASAAVTCREANVEPVVSTTIDAAIARTGAVHVAATIPDVSACGLATADRIVDDIAPDPALVSDGQISVPQQPGLGVEVSQ